MLVGLDHPLQPWLGKHGEGYFPVSRALKPRQLLQTLEHALALTTAPNDLSAPVHERLPVAKERFAGLTVLVAEDNEVNQLLLMLQLESLGVTATLTSNGIEALEALRAAPFNVILMDVEMPGMDGMEAAGRIAREPAFQDRVPYVIAVTAHVLSDSQARFRKSGMQDFISKPILMQQLEAALERAVRQLQLG